jgi:hypothetical protein
MDYINFSDTLTSYEEGLVYQFSDGLQEAFKLEHFDDLRTDILAFLDTYKDFTLDNHSEWSVINEQIEISIFNILQRADEKQEVYNNATKRSAIINHFIIKLALIILILGAEIVIIVNPNPQYKFNKDLYAISILIFGIAMCYPVVWIFYRILIKLFRV